MVHMEDARVLVLRLLPLGTLRRKICDKFVNKQACRMFSYYSELDRVRMRIVYEVSQS